MTRDFAGRKICPQMRVPAKQTAFGRTDFPASEVLALARTSSTASNLDDYKLLKFITI